MTHPANIACIAVVVGGLHSAHLQGVDTVGFDFQGFSEWDWVNLSSTKP